MRAGVFSAAVPPRQEPGMHLGSVHARFGARPVLDKQIILQTQMQAVLKIKINSLFVSCTRDFCDTCRPQEPGVPLTSGKAYHTRPQMQGSRVSGLTLQLRILNPK